MSSPYISAARNKLLQALQMAVLDLEEGHAPDPLRYVDYNLKNPSFLDRLETTLRKGTFRTSPPLEFTFPKSEFAIRPGKRIELEDLVVVYLCLLGLSRDLEDKLRFGVTAYRIRKGNPPRVMQGAAIILPKYLRRRLRFIFPWYHAWPFFVSRLRREYTRSGRRLIGTSDITSFYEDVDLGLLRDVLWSRVRKANRPLANLLVEMYQDWAARDVYLVRQNRGIPQGTASSGVVANYYLMPFDEELDRYARRKDLRWYRYNDDMRLIGRDREDIRLGLRAAGGHLARLNLIQQGSKTKILSGRDARRDLFDTRAERIQQLTSRIAKSKTLAGRTRQSIIKQLDGILATVDSGGRGDSTSLAMLYTAYAELRSDRLLARWKRDYLREPTRARVILNYVARFLDRPGQCRALTDLLASQRGSATDWEISHLLRVCRRMRHIPSEAPAIIGAISLSRNANWLPRQQAALTIAWFRLVSQGRALARSMATEWDDEVKRAILTTLFLLPPEEELDLLMRSSKDLAIKVSRMSNYILTLRSDAALAKASLGQFKEPNEIFLTDCFWRLYQIRWNRDHSTRQMLAKVVKDISAKLRGKYLISHVRQCM